MVPVFKLIQTHPNIFFTSQSFLIYIFDSCIPPSYYNILNNYYL